MIMLFGMASPPGAGWVIEEGAPDEAELDEVWATPLNKAKDFSVRRV